MVGDLNEYNDTFETVRAHVNRAAETRSHWFEGKKKTRGVLAQKKTIKNVETSVTVHVFS